MINHNLSQKWQNPHNITRTYHLILIQLSHIY